ncbi:sensor histidine kinase [Noviherbaspirillum sp.]|uniref:sensor histidine kinase n=1 Tax=Noviherbaspirillum sp. TaxID=1926288 RepID=UPI002FDF60ED
MIEQIQLYLLLTGATIGAVLAVLWYQARNASRISLALIRLNEQHRFDTPALLRNAWPLLSQAGLAGIAWRLDWFGVVIEEQAGTTKGVCIEHRIDVAETSLSIALYQPVRRGERRYFGENLIATFLLLLRTDMLIKANATDTTFAQMSKLNLFLQHDMKNIAQFIQLMADQLASVPPGKEQQVFDYLRTAAPMMRNRADRIVGTLTAGRLSDAPSRTVDLEEEIRTLCALYRLDCTIDGSARLRVPENTLDTALDNIFKNYSDLAERERQGRPEIRVAITGNGNGGTDITIEAVDASPVEHMERLFEPFWSSHPAGLGIGLYQAKQRLAACNASLHAQRTKQGGLKFHVALSASNMAPRHCFHM